MRNIETEGAEPEGVGPFLTPHAFRAALRQAIEIVEQAGEMDETDVERRRRRARRQPGPIRRGVKTWRRPKICRARSWMRRWTPCSAMAVWASSPARRAGS